MMLRRVVLVNMDDEGRDNDRDMMPKVSGVDVTHVPSPPHVAPSMTAAMYVYRRPGRNDGPDLVVRGGTSAQIEVRSRVS